MRVIGSILISGSQLKCPARGGYPWITSGCCDCHMLVSGRGSWVGEVHPWWRSLSNVHHRYCHSIVGTFTRLPPICLSLRSPCSNANSPSLLHAVSWTSSVSDSLSRLEYWRSVEASQLASIDPP